MAPSSDSSPSGHSPIANEAIPSMSTAQPTAQAAQGVGSSAYPSNASFTDRADANEQALEQEPLAVSPTGREASPVRREATRDAFASPSQPPQPAQPSSATRALQMLRTLPVEDLELVLRTANVGIPVLPQPDLRVPQWRNHSPFFDGAARRGKSDYNPSPAKYSILLGQKG
jgi:hypothetical protein